VAEVIAPKITVKAITEDEADNRILECAVAGKADLVVSGDHHLTRLISPDGKTLFDRPRFLETIGADPRSPSVIVMMPVMNITFDTTDLPGTYTIRVTVTDHVHSAYAEAEEEFQLIKGKSAEGEAAKKPATVPQTEHRVIAIF